MIRELNKNNISECVCVIRDSFRTVADELGFTVDNAPRFTAFAITEEGLRYQFEIEKRLMYAYFDDTDSIIGYYSIALQDNNECELNNLCVLPRHRHKQIGAELLKDACEKAKAVGCKKMNIGIVEENRILRKWYESSGFIHTSTKKFDFFPFTCGYMEKEL